MRAKIKFKIFRGILKKWETLFEEAARFATEVGRDNVVSISHSEDNEDGVVTVWYWSER